MKYYSDENGSISVRIQQDSAKVKLTNYPIKKGVPGSPMRTVNCREDILELLGLEDTKDNEDENLVRGW